MAGHSEYFSYLSLDPPAPVPESSPRSYTPEKVEERLKYVRERMKELNITPRSEIFLQLYQEAAESALEVTDEASRDSCCTRLYRYDRFIQENSFLCEEPTSAQRELEEKLLKLKRLEYYVRYGDYLARELSILKDAATTLQTDDHQELQQYWTTIAKKNEGRKRSFRSAAHRQDRTEEHPDITGDLGSSSSNEAISRKRMEEDIENMSAVIGSLRARYFTIDEGDEDDPDTWRANEEAVQYRHALRAETDAKNKKKAEIVEEMVERASKATKKRAKQAELVGNAILGKRKASQTFLLGEEMLAKKSKEMEKVVGIQLQVTRKEYKLDKLYRTQLMHWENLGEAVSAMGYPDVEE
ncbi:MAG: hypothetical protein M1840_002235 [Geoglossum simile]|nr:MAG: hypothetical protein M1840_002235 [Geoglossum simile]